ncbi:hypothetical protein [Pelomicrobium sp. G1]|uniref:hypothetical protein n=1 Tax=unclassified Pelomicrobium TaxID=2815318 RepID=UPI003F75916E
MADPLSQSLTLLKLSKIVQSKGGAIVTFPLEISRISKSPQGPQSQFDKSADSRAERPAKGVAPRHCPLSKAPSRFPFSCHTPLYSLIFFHFFPAAGAEGFAILAALPGGRRADERPPMSIRLTLGF